MNKTIALKILDQLKIFYECYEYDNTITNGIEVAEALAEKNKFNRLNVYKTLVTTDNNNHYLVFVIPVDKSLDLKKIATTLNKKKIEMIKQKDLEPLTGYIHGGCSPIGMKKKFPTYFDESVKELDFIYVSAGRVGLQMKIKVEDLIKVTNGQVLSLCKDEENV